MRGSTLRVSTHPPLELRVRHRPHPVQAVLVARRARFRVISGVDLAFQHLQKRTRWLRSSASAIIVCIDGFVKRTSKKKDRTRDGTNEASTAVQIHVAGSKQRGTRVGEQSKNRAESGCFAANSCNSVVERTGRKAVVVGVYKQRPSHCRGRKRRTFIFSSASSALNSGTHAGRNAEGALPGFREKIIL